MIPVPYWSEVFMELITHQAAVTAMRVLQFMDPKWISGYIISKSPGGLPLWWHQDWWAWDEPVSASEVAPYVFFMYYLVDTDHRNGCLRVIPGSHRQHIDLHDNLPAIHTPELNISPLDSPVHALHPNEVAVPVHAGDLVVGDARLLHSTYANSSSSRRTNITLWYVPDFRSLSCVLQSKLAKQNAVYRDGNVGFQSPELSKWLPTYSGPSIEYLPYQTIPDKHLRHE